MMQSCGFSYQWPYPALPSRNIGWNSGSDSHPIIEVSYFGSSRLTVLILVFRKAINPTEVERVFFEPYHVDATWKHSQSGLHCATIHYDVSIRPVIDRLEKKGLIALDFARRVFEEMGQVYV